MYIDFKVTVWQRYHLPEGTTIEEAIEIARNPNDFDGEWETLAETEEYIKPTPSNPTIEIFGESQTFDQEPRTLWDNDPAKTIENPQP